LKPLFPAFGKEKYILASEASSEKYIPASEAVFPSFGKIWYLPASQEKYVRKRSPDSFGKG